MSKTVWVSGAMTNPLLLKPLGADIDSAERYLLENDPEKYVSWLNDAGQPLPADRFPKEIYAKEDSRKITSLPDIFFAGSFWCVSAESANVLQQFDLGQGALYPVKVFQKDRKTRVEGEYFCLNFGNVKQVFLPEHSPTARQKPHITTPYWVPPFVMKDNDIAVSPAALDGPELWIEARFKTAFFVSDDLAKALKAAKVARPFGLRKCRIIENS